MPTNYSHQKVPPAPVLEIRLSPPCESARTNVLPALIDTGADFTLVPLRWLLEIDAPEVRWAFLRGLWSEPRNVTLYLVDVHFENQVLPGVEVAAVEDEEDMEVVLGRNILNDLIVLLDGPREQVDLLTRRPLKF